MDNDYSNHGPIDRDAQRLRQELDAVGARTEGGAIAARTARRLVIDRLRASVAAVREVLDGIAEANERSDRLNRPWVYEGAAWTKGSEAAIRVAPRGVASTPATAPQAVGSGAVGGPSDAAGAGLRAAC